MDDTIGGDARADSRQMSLDLPAGQVSDMVDQVFTFNEQVIGIRDVQLNPLSQLQHDWLIKFGQEELQEFTDEFRVQNVVGMVDAVIDLIYGAMGTFKKMGLTREQVRQCFTAVHTANMAKKRGNKGRGSDEDAIKPEGWVAPEDVISDILLGD